MFIRLNFTGDCDTAMEEICKARDILLPGMLHAFQLMRETQWIDLTVGRRHVALTCVQPNVAQVQYLTSSPFVVETFMLGADGKLVKTRSANNYS